MMRKAQLAFVAGIVLYIVGWWYIDLFGGWMMTTFSWIAALICMLAALYMANRTLL